MAGIRLSTVVSVFLLAPVLFGFSPATLQKAEIEEHAPDGTLLAQYEALDKGEGVFVRHGMAKLYHPNGERAAAGKYRSGLRIGTWKYWFPNGTKWEEGKYRDGVRAGSWSVWWPDGSFRGRETYDPFQRNHPGTEKPEITGSLLNGKRHGEWVWFTEAGKKWKSGSYREGLRSNDWTIWWDNGKRRLAGDYAQGERDGLWRSWWQNGGQQIEAQYVHGRREGNWRFWHADGSLDPELLSGSYRDNRRREDLRSSGVVLSAVKDPAPPPTFPDHIDATTVNEIRQDVQRLLVAKKPKVELAKITSRGKDAFAFLVEVFPLLNLEESSGRKQAKRVHDALTTICGGKGFPWAEGSELEHLEANRQTMRRWASFWELAKDANPEFWLVDLACRSRHLFDRPEDLLYMPPAHLGIPNQEPQDSRFAAAPSEQWQAYLDACDWLVRHQSPDGRWDSDDFGRQCVGSVCSGKGKKEFDVGLTALSVLALLQDENLRANEPALRAATAGVRWLIEMQDHEPRHGAIMPLVEQKSFEETVLVKSHTPYWAYQHAAATHALCLAAERWSSPMARKAAQSALDFVARARNPEGAWRYQYPPVGESDTSVTGWMLEALQAGYRAGLDVDRESVKQGLAYLEEMTDRGTWRTGYNEVGTAPARVQENINHWPAHFSESLTAVALVNRLHAGMVIDGHESVRGSADLLMLQLPRWEPETGTIDFYYWHFGTESMSLIGSHYLEVWGGALRRALLPQQSKSGDTKGSWDPASAAWGPLGGRIYTTAINAWTLSYLEVPRQDPG